MLKELTDSAFSRNWGTAVANNVQQIREALMMSKAELARKAGLSTLTIDRVESGKTCRLDTKRKILHALGLKVSDRDSVFGAGSAAELTSTNPYS
ncbi:MAG: helix-turn-helix transcriptional regulator [bacterium]|nr:helix-turn-helix transcriptional regulator [bacterium]